MEVCIWTVDWTEVWSVWSWQFFDANSVKGPGRYSLPGACFSKVPKLFGPISGATTAFISSQCLGSKRSNFAILLVFLILKICRKIGFSKQADCCLTTSFSGPKSSRDFRETGPCDPLQWRCSALPIELSDQVGAGRYLNFSGLPHYY